MVAVQGEDEAGDHLDIVRCPPADWAAESDDPDAPRPFLIKLERGSVRWRPGQAVIEGSSDPDVVAALIDFAFYEGELRHMESALAFYEATSRKDVSLAYRVKKSDSGQWERLARTMEALAAMRLEYARLEPFLSDAPRSLTQRARWIANRLLIRAGVPARLEAFSNRLEACEDLYEGAVDRIADFRWYRNGELLEVTIVVLLVLETIVMTAGLLMRVGG
jgi:hypothetical protein